MSIPQVEKLFDFGGQVVLVTGAGSGVGAAIARRFAEAGADVAVNYHSSAEAAQSVVEAITALGRKAVAIGADVTHKAEVERLMAGTLEAFGRLDVLVNNAGIYPLASFLEMDEEQWEEVLDANLRSAFLCSQAAAKRMIAQDIQGAIVNIASIEGRHPAVDHSHYNAAKAAVLMLTKSTATELGAHGIRVNAVSPGLIWRPGLERDWPEGVARWKAKAPLERLGRAEDVADACLFLASPAARWITGANLVVDGGVSASPIF